MTDHNRKHGSVRWISAGLAHDDGEDRSVFRRYNLAATHVAPGGWLLYSLATLAVLGLLWILDYWSLLGYHFE